MKIETKGRTKTLLEDVEPGVVFYFNESYWLKCDQPYKAVGLAHGILMEFCANHEVELVEATVVIGEQDNED